MVHSKSETTGPKPIKPCLNCGINLRVGVNWSLSRERKHDYVCRYCNTIRSNQPHLYHGNSLFRQTGSVPTPGHFNTLEQHRIRAEREARRTPVGIQEAAQRDGFVYVIQNPIHVGMVKVGRTRDLQRRLGSANTWCPEGGFTVEHFTFFKDAHGAEADVHMSLRNYRVQREWFKCDVPEVITAIKEVKRYQDENNTLTRR